MGVATQAPRPDWEDLIGLGRICWLLGDDIHSLRRNDIVSHGRDNAQFLLSRSCYFFYFADMSTRVSIPGTILNDFRTAFHLDYPYEIRHRRDNLILESCEGDRFHFDRESVIKASGVFADASELAFPDDSPQPIILTFASTAGLRYFLALLRQPSRPSQPSDNIGEVTKPVTVPPSTIIAAIRIAHVLDVPTVGRKVLDQDKLDVYLRYAIERTFDVRKTGLEDHDHPSSRPRDTCDISFHLRPQDQFQRSLLLLQEINPAATKSLVRFHHDRQYAISMIEQWWSTGIRVGRVLRSTRPMQVSHVRYCKRRFASEGGFARELPKVAATALIALAKSKSKIERVENIGAVLIAHAHGCRGCLSRLESVYLPALRSFNADFPAIPR